MLSLCAAAAAAVVAPAATAAAAATTAADAAGGDCNLGLYNHPNSGTLTADPELDPPVFLPGAAALIGVP